MGLEPRTRARIAPHGYEKAIERKTKKYGMTDILLASDQSDAISWAKEQKKFDVHWLGTARSKLKHGKGWIENMGDIDKEETEGCAGGAGFSPSRAGVHREHGLVLQPRGV